MGGVGAWCPFQFHLGTIKTFIYLKKGTLVTIFQFHLGTIKTPVPAYGTTLLTTFQFHLGTIKTVVPNRQA